jgi:ABC-type transporter Mla subunit MlaD
MADDKLVDAAYAIERALQSMTTEIAEVARKLDKIHNVLESIGEIAVDVTTMLERIAKGVERP